MEQALFKCLFGKANDLIVKLMASVTSDVSLQYRSCYQNVLNYNNGSKCQKLTEIKKVEFHWL